MTPVPMLNVPPPHMMMSNPASALMPLNPFSAPPPSFNAQIFGNAVPVPTTNTATDDHMDIEGEEEVSNNNKNASKTQDGGHNNTLTQTVFNQPPRTMGQRDSDRQSREPQNRRNSDNYDRNDRRHGNRWNSAEREDSYERDNRRSRGMRHSGGPMRNDREKPLQDRLRDMAGIENRGNNGGQGRYGGYDRDNNYGPRDNRGGRYNDNSHHQMGMQRNGEYRTILFNQYA